MLAELAVNEKVVDNNEENNCLKFRGNAERSEPRVITNFGLITLFLSAQ
jgi:hypothetical protein